MTQPATAPQKAASEPSLLPCPFCGSTNVRYSANDLDGWVFCLDDNCGACGPTAESPRPNIAAAWNRRIPPAVAEHALERLAALEAASKEFSDAYWSGAQPADSYFERLDAAARALRHLLG